ncbi:Hint domain-containing protein [Streptomyces sp. NPDC058301]|uniref:Hint domain-containing protein n=1 Tax=Streptomyces sp. NPDC058301 TaxID=3346436 RepID=UPI0036E561A2
MSEIHEARAGGLAGKILAKYGAPWKWAKGVRLVKKVAGLIADLVSGVKDVAKSSKALAKAKDALAAARAKAKAAIGKAKKDDPTSCHSFPPGTKVLLADGSTKPIDKVALDDKVVTTDPATGETTIREVVGTIVTEDDKHFVDLTIKARGGSSGSLIATTTHPFWVKSKNAWIEAGGLKPGMTLREPDGSTATVEGVRHRSTLMQ